MANPHAVYHRNIGKEGEYFVYTFKEPLDYNGKLAVQPYLVAVLERVLNAVGITVNANEIRQTWMRNVFIANAKETLLVKKILPHWTVEEFIKEIENFFGCYININTDDNSSEIITYEINDDLRTIELHEVVDETSSDIEIDDEERFETIIAGNVEYAQFYESNILRLPDEVWEKAIVKIFDTKDDIDTFITNIPDDEYKKSRYLFCNRADGRVYAILYLDYDLEGRHYLWGPYEVDLCPALIRNGQFSKNRKIDVTLRITPCIMYANKIDYVRNQIRNYNYLTMDMPLSPESRYMSYTDEFSVNDAIFNEGEENENTPEIIPIAWNTMRRAAAWALPDPMQPPIVFYVPYAVGLTQEMLAENHFQYIGDSDTDNLCLSSREFAKTRFSQNINTKVVRQFSFTDNINPLPNAIYLIRGKRYLCQKIEVTIDEDGVQPLKKGYFYEMD